jgi:Zn-dependent membrane protease YugP
MEAKKKFKLKRRYKTFIWVEFSSMLFWVLFFIGLVVVRKNSDGDWSELGIIIPVMLVFISPLM